MPEINYELLDFTMKYIETHPENHNQGFWVVGEPIEESGTQVADMNVCGTSACFAGWASIFAGWHQCHSYPACYDCYASESEGCNCDSGDPPYERRDDLVVDETGHVTSMQKAAQESLGLRRDQATALFAGYNMRPTLNAMVIRLHEDGDAYL